MSVRAPRVGPLPGLALAAAALTVAAGAAAAQEEAGSRPGWLGVGIQETLVCPGPGGDAPEVVTPEDCRRVYVAEAVVEGAPAAAAGIRPGDTLVAMNGRPLASARGARVLRSLQPGRPVELLVGREGGRTSVRVTPAPRPPEMGRLTLRTPLAPTDAGTTSVAPGTILRWSRALEGVEAPEALARDLQGVGLRVDRQGRVYLHGDGQLVRLRGVEAERIRALRDSVMREARERLRRLREQAPPAPPPGAGRVLTRMAGAELRALEPGLSEHFEGVDRGLLVLRVLPGTPAYELGLRPGDVVVEAAGRPTHRPAQLRSAIRELASSDSVVVRWMRRGEERSGALRRP